MVKTERICRLCLKICKTDFKAIDETANQILHTLSLKVDLSITKEPVICHSCMSTLQTTTNLLSTCQDTRDVIFSSTTNKTLNIKGIKNANISESISNRCKVCLFCMRVVKNDSYALLNQLEERLVEVKQFLPKCIFDLYIAIGEEPILCEFCYNSIQHHINYLKSYIETEHRVRYCYKIEKFDRKSQIDLDHVLRFTLTQNGGDAGELNEVNTHGCEHSIGTEVPLKIEDSEKLDVYIEEKSKVVNKISDCTNTENFSIEDATICSVHEHEAHSKSASYMEYKYHTCLYQTVTEGKDTETYKCNSCPYETKNQTDFKKHFAVHSDTSKTPLYKCNTCSYRTRRQWYFKIHTLLHKKGSQTSTYDCEVCLYQTRNKTNFRRHLLNHYGVTQYRCDKCPYVTKHKQYFKGHKIIHKNASEVTTYKCESCMYTTSYKSVLKLHVTLHKDASEVTMYHCERCPYKARTKYRLKLHSLIHKHYSEVKLHKCEFCSHKTKRYSSLRQHMIVHKKPSETRMFKCDICGFETKWKSNLKQHMIIHKNPSEVMHK